MTSFARWLRFLILALSFGLPTLGCQVLFGDFKVGARNGDQGQSGQGGSTENAGGGLAGSPAGGLDSAQAMGPIIVTPSRDLFTSDLGATAKFSVYLAQKPSAPVTIPIVSSNENEGKADPASLSFTTDDWSAPQTVTVTGEHDPQVGNQMYTVDVGPASSADKVFEGAKVSVLITNIDNDGPGFFVTPTSGLVTTEAGGEAVFTVVLNSRPKANVTVSLSSRDGNIGQVSPASLTFTSENYRAPQTVRVIGVDNEEADGDRKYEIQVGPLQSDDEAFAKLPPQNVSVTNQDNDKPGVIVELTTGIDPSDTTRLRTGENGDLATFTVALRQKPASDVTIKVESSSDEGTTNPDSLTFTQLNWAARQTVTVVGRDNDTVADGNQPYQIKLGPITSDDLSYRALTRADLPTVNVINVDNDRADVALTLLTGLDPNDASQLNTSEKAGAASFSLVLTSKPSAPVRFQLSSTILTEGTVSPAQLEFTLSNWNVAQVVTVTGVNEYTKDGNVVYAVRISAPTTDDLDYQKVPTRDVKVVNLDDDVAGITPPKLLSGIDSGTKLVTSESGGTATFSISLTSKPKDDVTVPVMSSNTAEGKVGPMTLTFTPANYATAQIVTVTGQNDPIVDGNQAYTVTVGPSTSADSNYAQLSQSVKVTNQDDDSAYIVVMPNSNATTTEKGGSAGSATFNISLHSQPTQPVTLTFVSSNTGEGKVSPGSLLFTPDNWSKTQNVTVTGVDDDKDDGDQSYTVAVKGTNTTDPNYMYAATTLSLVNKNDDTAGLKVTAATGLQTTEAGNGKVTFTVALTSQPTSDVNVAVTSSAPKEGTVSSLQPFTTNNWSTAQTVTVTGVDEKVADGNQPYTVSLKASSADTKYAQLATSTVSIVNKDDDVIGIIVTPTSCATTPGMTATFTVVLNSQPLGPVSVAISSDTPTEGTVPMSTTASFTTANWNTAQTITVTGMDGTAPDMMTSYKIVTAAAVSTDPAYNGVNPADVACVNTTPPAPVGP